MNLKKQRLICFILSAVALVSVFIFLSANFRPSAANKIYERNYTQYTKDLINYNDKYNTLARSAKNEIIFNQNEKNSGEFKVSISVQCDYNNSVGNEWIYRTYINDEQVLSGNIVSVPLYNDSKISIECIEVDSNPDYAKNTYNMTFGDYISFNVSPSIINTEHSGRYTGNTAKHTFNLSFERYVSNDLIETAIKDKLPEKPQEPQRSMIYNSLSCFDIMSECPEMIFILIVLMLFCIYASHCHMKDCKDKQKILKESEQLKKAEYLKQELVNRENRENKEKEDFLSVYGGKTDEEILRIVGAPKDVTINHYGLPSKTINGVDIYDVYYTTNGSKYHSEHCKYAFKNGRHNLVYAYKKEPCTICNPIKDDLKWYRKYNEIVQKREFYNK